MKIFVGASPHTEDLGLFSDGLEAGAFRLVAEYESARRGQREAAKAFLEE